MMAIRTLKGPRIDWDARERAELLRTMTQQRWDELSAAERDRLRDNSGLTAQLVGLEGKRVRVETKSGETRSFWVGRSTGWRPCHIELPNSRSSGGLPASREYKSVTIVKHRRQS